MPTLQDLQELEELDRLAQKRDAPVPKERTNLDALKDFGEEAWHKVKLGASALAKGVTSNVVGALDVMGSQPDIIDAVRAQQGLKPRQFTKLGEIPEAVDKMGEQPRTFTDKLINAAGQGAGGALTSPSALIAPGRAAITGAGAGLGADLAGSVQGIKGTQYQVPASLLGGLAGGGLAGFAASQTKNLPDVAGEVLGNIDKRDIQKTIRRMVEARTEGVDLNAAQAMRKPSNMDNAITTLTKTKEGQVLVDQLRNQSKQTRDLAGRMAAVVPGNVRGDQVIANNTQQAATDTLRNARLNRTAETAPLFQQAGDMPSDLLDSIVAQVQEAAKANPDTNKGQLLGKLAGVLQNAQQRGKPQPSGLLDAAGEPIMVAGTPVPMQEVNASMRSILNNAKDVNVSSSPGDREAIGGLQNMIGNIRDQMSARSPNFRDANALYAQITNDRVNPLKKGVIGEVAGMQGALSDKAAPEKFANILAQGRSPNAPASDSKILQFAVETRENPTVFRDAVKTHFNNAIDAADKMQGNVASPNFARDFTKELLGDATKRQGFKDMLNGIERNAEIPMPPNTLYKGMLNGMKTLQAASKRPGSIGPSGTELGDIAGQSKIAETGRFLNWNAFAHAGDKVSRWLSSDAYRKLSEGLSTPEGLAQLQKLATVPPMSKQAQGILSTLFGLGGSAPKQTTQPEEEQQNGMER